MLTLIQCFIKSIISNFNLRVIYHKICHLKLNHSLMYSSSSSSLKIPLFLTTSLIPLSSISLKYWTKISIERTLSAAYFLKFSSFSLSNTFDKIFELSYTLHLGHNNLLHSHIVQVDKLPSGRRQIPNQKITILYTSTLI